MTIVELRYLLAVAEERSFRKAAERVHVSQPALSFAVQRLERELGVVLFERGSKAVTLTSAGEAVAAQARRALDEVAKIREVAMAGRGPLTGSLRLGALHTVAPYLFPVLTRLARQRHPQLSLAVEEGLTTSLTERLERGELDAALIALPFDHPGVVTLAVFDEPFEVILPRDHALTHQVTVAPGALSGEHVLLLNSGHCYSNQVADACPGVGERAEVIEGNSLETVRNLVASGHGISVFPRSAARSPATVAQLEVRPFTEPAPRRRIALAWRRSFARPEVLEALAELICDSESGDVEPLRTTAGR